LQTAGVKERDTLHRAIRDHDPDRWEPACHVLGELAVSDQSAYTAMCDLLLSSVPELRLKGLVALRTMAPAQPQEVLRFLADRVAEARNDYDPILLDATFFVFAALPGQLGQTAVETYLNDVSEEVRAAAAAALPFWPEWPDGTLQRVAQDPSGLVKAGLITALRHMDESCDKRNAMESLRQSSDPQLSALLEELFGAPLNVLANPVLSPLDNDQIYQLLRERNPSPIDVGRFEQALDEDPATCLKLLRASLSSPGGSVVLKPLSDLCRNSTLGIFFRAWDSIFNRTVPLSEELTLQVLGVLEEEPDSPFLDPFREFVKACSEATECSNAEALLSWCCRHQVRAAALSLWNPSTFKGLSLASEALQWLNTLAKVGGEFQDLSLFQLSNLSSQLEGFYSDLRAGCPRPERDLLFAVLNAWQRLLVQETDALMGGGELP
jgi:hypothetical protein